MRLKNGGAIDTLKTVFRSLVLQLQTASYTATTCASYINNDVIATAPLRSFAGPPDSGGGGGGGGRGVGQASRVSIIAESGQGSPVETRTFFH